MKMFYINKTVRKKNTQNNKWHSKMIFQQMNLKNHFKMTVVVMDAIDVFGMFIMKIYKNTKNNKIRNNYKNE